MDSLKRKGGTVEEGERAGKRPFQPQVSVYHFEVLMPHGITFNVRFRHGGTRMALSEFANKVKQAYDELPLLAIKKRKVDWLSPKLHFVDAFENSVRPDMNFAKFPPNVTHILRLRDGSAEAESAHKFENMWDLTPHTDLLQELPEEYTFETALADLIDNSLQAIWSNEAGQRKLIKVDIVDNGIEIFDTGSGMDASPENSIVKWGKLGASLHRSVRERGIGTKPPYLTPCFGMFGFGGPMAAMHLGRQALVASKTKQSKKVFLLHLEKEAILRSYSGQAWRADGGVRDPKRMETKESPHGSFTKVRIHEAKLKSSIEQVRCRLKDIYFPYIQCDELSATGQTMNPIEFQVNSVDLAEVLGGEVAVTNMHSCNGPEFTLQLQFTSFEASNSPADKRSREANARLRCVYFPIIQGKESIENILEKLTEGGCGTGENFKNFSRVSIRRLGRLLPEARWAWLPFMEPKQKRSVIGQILRRLCYRVKCFIDTDGGFNPTTSKTDLAPQNLFTIALKTFGKKQPNKETDVNVTITKDGRKLSLSELEKLYEEWLKYMHNHYDQEMVSGCDEATFVFDPPNKEGFGISSSVIRVHKSFWRNGALWESGQNVKILKGACAGFHRTDTYATLEYIILEGVEEEAGCEARLICRPIEVPAESGCFLTQHKGGTSIKLGSSFSIPVSAIDSQKFIAVDDEMWQKQIQKRSLKAPSCIEILNAADCHELGIEGEIPQCVDAGYVPPENIVAIIRPLSFKSDQSSKNLDGKQIVQEQILMMMKIKFRAEDTCTEYENIFSGQMSPSSRRSINGFYIFKLRKECPKIFEKAGLYTFLFSLKEYENVNYEKEVKVKALLEGASWRLLDENQMTNFAARVGLVIPPVSIGCFDKYSNRLPFASNSRCLMELKTTSYTDFTFTLTNEKVVMSTDRLTVTLKDATVICSDLDKIRPSYNAIMRISSDDEQYFVTTPIKVLPGAPGRVLLDPASHEKALIPGEIIKNMVLEVFDENDNHVQEYEQISLQLDGLRIIDGRSLTFKVDQNGSVDLSGILRVVKGFGQRGSFSVFSGGKSILEKAFQTEGRELRPAFEIPITITAGKHLENLAFEVVKANGEIDEGIHSQGKDGGSHTLSISSDSFELDSSRRYNFSYGRCIIQEIPVPNKEGQLCFKVAHSHHPELNLNVEVHILEDYLHDFEDEGYDHSDSDVPSSDVNLEKCAQNDDKAPSRKGKQLAADLEKSANDLQIGFPLESPIPCAVLEPGINGQPDSPTDYDPTDTVEADHMESWDHLTTDELEFEILKTGERIKEVETKIRSLVSEQSLLKESISKLQAEYVLLSESKPFSFACKQKLVKEHISLKTDSAAAAICQLSQPSLSEGIQCEFAENILGVVACIGSVQNVYLSIMLAHYLGEHQMLGIVCKCEEESLLESDGRFQALAAKLGMPLPKNYHLYCMEKIRPYSGSVSDDPRRELQLPNPRLPSGKCPPGFLGYAVNLIELDIKLRPWRTASGRHGLRETLLYRLFGTLQVYKSKEQLRLARSCIKKDAVSLDGAILRGNGVISLALSDVDVQFPVCPRGNPTLEEAELGGRTEANMAALREVGDLLGKEIAEHEKIMKRFRMQEKRFKFLCYENMHKDSQKLLAMVPWQETFPGIKEENTETLALMPPPPPLPLPETSSGIKEENTETLALMPPPPPLPLPETSSGIKEEPE